MFLIYFKKETKTQNKTNKVNLFTLNKVKY